MAEHSTTPCLMFPDLAGKRVVAPFDQRQGSSDGGAILWKAADRRLQLIPALADCLQDERPAGQVDHAREERLAPRVFALACGYADAQDAARLAADPGHQMRLGRAAGEGADLASQPSLRRFANAPDRKPL